MSSTTIARTETGFGVTTAFQSMDNLMASTLSSAFVIPTGYSRIAHISCGAATDDVTESCVMFRLSNNAMIDSEQYVTGPSINTIASSVGAFDGNVEHDVDFAVRPGSSLTLSVAATAAFTGDFSIIITLV